MSTMPGLKSKIAYYKLEEKVIDMLFKERLSYGDISKRLKTENNLDISLAALTVFKKNALKMASEFLANDEEYKKTIAKRLLDTTENLAYALDKIKDKIEAFETKGDWKQQSTYLNLMLTELHLLLKRAGEIKPAQIIENQTINTMQINNIIQMELVRMIDAGHIPLESCDSVVKEFYRKAKQNAVAV